MNYNNTKIELYKTLKNGISDIDINEKDLLNIKYVFFSDTDNLYYNLDKKQYDDELIKELLNSYVTTYILNIHKIYNATNEILLKMKVIENMRIDYNYMPYDFRESYDYVHLSKNLFIDILTQNRDYNLLITDLNKIMDFYSTIKNPKERKRKIATTKYKDSEIPKRILEAIKGVENE